MPHPRNYCANVGKTSASRRQWSWLREYADPSQFRLKKWEDVANKDCLRRRSTQTLTFVQNKFAALHKAKIST